MPDLANRVGVVKTAVNNLVKVGHDTINESTDALLERDMPPALFRVEEASQFLQDAVQLLTSDPISQLGRKRLIEGSRGILQGTLSVLVAFDLSEVRKIVEYCKSVLNMLGQVEHIRSFSELAEFVKNLTPCMARMIKEVDERQQELVIQSHAELLERGIAQVKRITPILISSIKLFLNTTQQGLPAAREAQLNRDYFLHQMSDEIQEIIRGLQLTSADDIDWQCGEHAGLRSAKNLIGRLAKYASAWLTDPLALNASSGEKAICQILDAARRFETLCLSDAERNGLAGLIRALHSEVDDLVAAHQRGDAVAAREIGAAGQQNFAKLLDLCDALCERTEHHNAIYRLARTLEGKVTQVQRWLAAPRGSQRQVGYEACRALISEAGLLIKLEASSAGDSRSSAGGQDSLEAFQECCDNLQRSADCLYAQAEKTFSPEQDKIEHKMAQEISRNLAYLWHCLQFGLVRQVADFFTDLMGPIKHLQEVACPPPGEPVNEEEYRIASDTFLEHSRRVGQTANLAASNLIDPWRGDALQALASNLESVGGQVSLAGQAVVSARRTGASSQLLSAASDHLDLVKRHWTDCAERTRNLVDEAVDANAFIRAQESRILQDTERTEDSVDQRCPTTVVNSTTSIALRANRVLQVAIKETENSEDAVYVDRVNEAVQRLRSTITPMVTDAKNMVLSLEDPAARDRWRASSKSLVAAVDNVGRVVVPSYLSSQFRDSMTPYPPHFHRNDAREPPYDTPTKELQQLTLRTTNGSAKEQASFRYPNGTTNSADEASSTFRPELPLPIRTFPLQSRIFKIPGSASLSDTESARPLSPETDIEDEFNYPPPNENQPIMAAAHALHQEARMWYSRDNDLIAATKRIASLMAKLSQIVRGEYGTKKDLITVAMEIAECSLEVTRCAKALAKECTDRRMKSNLSQLSDRILTIGNQLRILSTVKATMLGNECWNDLPLSSELECDSSEDQENTEVLVGNAQNLMQAVIETVRGAECASIKMRVDSGLRMRWQPRPIANTCY
ncbi:hypothetical protein AAHC03_01509 [Spirometra sp. Aus1]